MLAIRLDSIGDVLMTTAALDAIGQNGRHLTLLTSLAGAQIARLVPAINDVIAFAAPWMKGNGPSSPASDRALIAELARLRFDAAVIFTVFSHTPFPAAVFARLAGIPRVLMHARERGHDLASDIVEETEPEKGIRHEVQRQLDLVGQVGWQPHRIRLTLVPGKAAQGRADRIAPAGRPWAVIHPGAGAPSQRWPAGHFVRAIEMLAVEHGWQLVLTGGPDEAALCEDIAAHSGGAARNIAGQLDLETLAALIGRAPVVITNNTGPAHLAAAMGTPVVVPYALTSPQNTPWKVPRRVLRNDVACRWCHSSTCLADHHLCMKGIEPERVVSAAIDVTRPDRLRGVV